MTFQQIETSNFEGQPIELYEFSVGSNFWRYTSSDGDQPVSNDVTFQGQVYSAVPMQRRSIDQSQELNRNSITLSTTNDLEFSQQYVAAPPSGVVMLTIRRFHPDDPDNEFSVIWVGRVLNVSFNRANSSEIVCEPIFTSLRRSTLRRLYQTTCPHVLYGGVCRADRNTFRLTTTVQAIPDSLIIQSTDFASQINGYYTGGFLELDKGGIVTTRFIVSHTGNQIGINAPLQDLELLDSIRVFPGCDRRLTTCVNKFSNEDNFGGMPYIPNKNPFSGAPVL